MKINVGATLNFTLFSGLGLFSYLLLTNYMNMNQAITAVLSSVWAIVFFIIAFNILGYATIRLSSWINNQYALYIAGRWKIVVIYMVVMMLFFTLNYSLLVTAKLLVGAEHPFSFPNGGVMLLIIIWLVEMVVLGLMIANKSTKHTMKLQQRAAQLQQENNTAQYTALQNQLNPHFLFNSLNTLIAQIEYNPQSAVVFTRHLSDVYRYVLQNQNRPLVSLGEELDFARAYLSLHRVRLGECIEWNSTVELQYRECMLPPLTLQLLVENVIKHNTITINKPMKIDIFIQNDYLVLSNSINRKKSTYESGVGLQNLANRCRLMLGREISITDTDNQFTVKIPISKQDE